MIDHKHIYNFTLVPIWKPKNTVYIKKHCVTKNVTPKNVIKEFEKKNQNAKRPLIWTSKLTFSISRN